MRFDTTRRLGLLTFLLSATLFTFIDAVGIPLKPNGPANTRRDPAERKGVAFGNSETDANLDLDPEYTASDPDATRHRIIILGGGVAGIMAAQTLHENGIDDFVIVEAREELGGRMQTQSFGKVKGKSYVLEKGANWIQGTQEDDGPANPIHLLAKKHGLETRLNDWHSSITTYDQTGQVDFMDDVWTAVGNHKASIVYAGERVDRGLIDLTARTGYSMVGAKPASPHARAAEYLQFDWEYANSPEQSSHIAAAWGNNYTYESLQGGFSSDNRMSVDQRGFKSIILAEKEAFLQTNQLMLNSTVKTIHHSDQGVSVTLSNGKTLVGDFALCTFSIGVLQNNEVEFDPPLPDYKQEAIESMSMGTYTKIFLQFPTKFWFDTEMALYADAERGRYPVWQSLDHEGFFPGSGILFTTVTGDFAKRVEALSDQQVKGEVMSVVRSMFPNVTIPEPVDFYLPRWHANPLFRGSFSNWRPSVTREHMDNIRANVGRLYFAGEATSRKYFGYLHGAFFEGKTMAQSIADCILTEKCSPITGREAYEEASQAHLHLDNN